MQKVSNYTKMKVLAAVEVAEGRTIRERIRVVSELSFSDEQGTEHRFTWRTIETWRLRYRKHGQTALWNKARSDKGKSRKVSPEELLEAIEQAKAFLRPGFKPSDLYRTCIEKGLLRREQIAPNTFRRKIKQYELLKSEKEVTSKKRLAFAKRFANEMWQADTLYGPYVRDAQGKARQTRLIAFIDDASRLLCHGQFFFNENHNALKIALRTALYKRGIPETLYVDNGSIYSGKDLTLICARIGCILCHTPVRDGAAKGKIERFFRTLRDQFLSRQLDLSSLSRLNEVFIAWAEDSYNHQLHSTLGIKPVDRFGLDLKRIRYLSTHAHTDELFLRECSRQVGADNTFRFSGKRWEAPRDLRNRKIQIRHQTDDQGKPSDPLILYYQNERQGPASLVDFYANDRAPKKLKSTPPDTSNQSQINP